jgi:hypothetical protein
MFTLDMDILTRNPGAGVIKAMRGFLAFQASSALGYLALALSLSVSLSLHLSRSLSLSLYVSLTLPLSLTHTLNPGHVGPGVSPEP